MRKWEVWKTNIEKSNNLRILQQLSLHVQQTIQATSVQDLDRRLCSDNAHVSVLPHEMVTIEPGETGNLWISQVISSVELMMIVSLFVYG